MLAKLQISYQSSQPALEGKSAISRLSLHTKANQLSVVSACTRRQISYQSSQPALEGKSAISHLSLHTKANQLSVVSACTRRQISYQSSQPAHEESHENWCFLWSSSSTLAAVHVQWQSRYSSGRLDISGDICKYCSFNCLITVLWCEHQKRMWLKWQ